MHLVLDYGGVIVEHGDERKQADVLGVDPERDPYPGWLAYFAFRDGFIQSTAEYLELLSTLTGASHDACRDYLEQTWLAPEFPAEHVDVIRELATDHTLVIFGNMARPWIETVLSEHGVLDCFDDLVVSSDLRRSKPHPKGYVECLPEGDEPVAFVSDEYNEDLLMGETFGMTSVWLENDDDEPPYREPDVRISNFGDLLDVLEGDEFSSVR
ncbi:FMN phosphatase YigB, HAD superfamily [Halogranum gelatinilyticum]|uniref:FMN phosphatase YigB, HAD superfamily n=1 Tax=Halogranum gelatinilyticum TaxID=660521 RepID=A0A1H0A000_9EURY|nr:HAD family hydrolase [Halogranum gelatinilyticum]SDN26697.1 FMN phosphatase YigB, HAD superfamily [Halogranum gelatinilyticum]